MQCLAYEERIVVGVIKVCDEQIDTWKSAQSHDNVETLLDRFIKNYTTQGKLAIANMWWACPLTQQFHWYKYVLVKLS